MAIIHIVITYIIMNNISYHHQNQYDIIDLLCFSSLDFKTSNSNENMTKEKIKAKILYYY